MSVAKIEKIFKDAGLNVRDSQVQMVEQIRQAVLKGQKIVIEAGTGVGKTFAYLLGTYLAQLDVKEKKQIIISTNTVALQEQLIEKDLPDLKKLVEDPFTYVIAKGRNRYICHKRLANAHMGELKLDQTVLEDLEERLEKGWNGDIDELRKPPPYSDWNEVCNTSTTCIGKRCEFVKECAFIQARRRLRHSDIVVVNHSLLLSHLSFGDGAILPEFEKSIYIIDECHHLPGKALSAFSGQLTVMGSQKWINDVDKTLSGLPGKVSQGVDLKILQESKKVLVTSLTDAQAILHQLYQRRNKQERDDDILRLRMVPNDLEVIAKNIRQSALIYQSVVKQAKKELDKFAEESEIHSESSMDRQFSALNFYNERIGNLLYVWEMLMSHAEPPVAKWLQPHDTQSADQEEGNRQDYTIFVSATVAGHLLEQMFWSQTPNSVVMCSATLRSLGDFEQFKISAGLEHDVKTVYYPSPFAYEKSQLELPNVKYAPQHPDHIKECSSYISEVLQAAIQQKQKGFLVLFTSLYAMDRTFSLLPKSLQKMILLQGDKSKSAMIAAHKKMIDYGKPSIIFGVDSFAEGVDLPGEYLELLIIHKLPFSVPSDPIAQTRNEWLESQGKNAFVEVSLPEASLKLTQMVGRLIRDEEDVGKVIILDNRLKTKFYGKQLLENLPPFDVSDAIATN